MTILPASTAPFRRGSVVVATTFMTLVVTYGSWYAYSVFLVALLREFGWTRSVVAGAFSVFVLVHGLVGPGVGWLLRVAGPKRLILAGGGVMGLGLYLTAETTAWWHLYAAFGVIASVGISLSGWIPSVILVGGWFPQRVSTAVGIASAGIGMGIFALVPLAQFLIDWVGWRWTFRILATLIIGWVIPATFWIVQDPPGFETAAPSSKSSVSRAAPVGSYWTLGAATRHLRFWILAGAFFTGTFVTQMLLLHQVAYLVDHGVSPIVAATVGGIVGLISIGSKMGWGWFSDRAGRELAYGLASIFVIASIGALALAGAHPTSLLPYLYAILIGVGYGVMAPVPPAAASDLYSGPGFSTIYGTLYMLVGLGLASGTWGAGLIFDRTGSYALALWLGLGMAMLSPVLLWFVAPRRPNPPPAVRQ